MVSSKIDVRYEMRGTPIIEENGLYVRILFKIKFWGKQTWRESNLGIKHSCVLEEIDICKNFIVKELSKDFPVRNEQVGSYQGDVIFFPDLAILFWVRKEGIIAEVRQKVGNLFSGKDREAQLRYDSSYMFLCNNPCLQHPWW